MFHPINLCPFDKILKDCQCTQSDAADNRAAWQFDPMGGLAGHLTVNKSQKGLVGVGAFKTAHDRVLSLVSLIPSGLGSEQRQKVVIKQPFFRSHSATGKVNIIQRYTFATDLSKLFREANILYWAKSLLDLTYMFIDTAIESSAAPPFKVPQLRFVDARLALVHSPALKSATGVYLVEEKIVCGRNEFVKFIHNCDFGPSIKSDEDGYDIAKFLVFTQHVQYVKTKGLAFISDYQGKYIASYTPYLVGDQDLGNSSLLMDPQILTVPLVFHVVWLVVLLITSTSQVPRGRTRYVRRRKPHRWGEDVQGTTHLQSLLSLAGFRAEGIRTRVGGGLITSRAHVNPFLIITYIFFLRKPMSKDFYLFGVSTIAYSCTHRT